MSKRKVDLGEKEAMNGRIEKIKSDLGEAQNYIC